MYVNFLSTYSDKKSCHASTTLQTSIARFVSDSWASCFKREVKLSDTSSHHRRGALQRNAAIFELLRAFDHIWVAPHYLSELIQPLSDVWLPSSTTFCIHGWSSGAGYAALNHWRPCSCRRQSTCSEQSSSRSAPIPDIFYFQNTPEVTYVQHIIPFSLTVSLTIFVQSPWSRFCAAYASLNLSLLYIALNVHTLWHIHT